MVVVAVVEEEGGDGAEEDKSRYLIFDCGGWWLFYRSEVRLLDL